MFKQIRTARIGVTEEDVIFDEIADILETADKLAGDFRTQHVRTDIQQKVYDLIMTSEIPDGQVLHLLLYGSIGCLDADTHIPYVIKKHNKIINRKGGTIKKLFYRFNRIKEKDGRVPLLDPQVEFYLTSSTPEGILLSNRIVGVYSSGFKECLKLEVEDGKFIIATADHKFFTPNGYVPLSQLQVGSIIYCHRNRKKRDKKIHKNRKYLFVKHHPIAGIKVIENKYVYHRLLRSRAVVEADMNGLSYDEYIDRLNSNHLEGLIFLPRELEVHHIDGNTMNDDISNLAILTKAEHTKLHTSDKNSPQHSKFRAVPLKIKSISSVGIRETYDIEMAAPYNNFVANGFIAHNSGKTWCALSYLTEVILDYPGACILGARRTYNEIEDAMFSTFERFLSQYNIPYRTNRKYTTITLNNGSLIRMRSADKVATSKSDKADYLGGTEYSGAVLDEADEIPEEFARTVAGRMRQNVGVNKKVIFYICNPPSKDHWLYRWFFEEHNPDDPKSKYRAVWMPVHANVEHVGQAYIDSIHADYADNPALYKRMVEGRFGPAVKGYPVFANIFSREFHVSKTDIRQGWDKELPIWLCFDFGWRRPAAVAFQDDKSLNQIRVLYEYLGNKEVLDSFADKVLADIYRYFPGADILCACDPAGKQMNDRSTLNSIDILRGKGLRPKFRRTAIEYGINILAELFSRTVPTRMGPQPAILIDPSCKILIDGFEFGYCQEKARVDGGTFDEDSRQPIKIVKDGYYEHLIDALRYGIIFVRKPNQVYKESYTRFNEYQTLDKAEYIRRGDLDISRYTRVLREFGMKKHARLGGYNFNKGNFNG